MSAALDIVEGDAWALMSRVNAVEGWPRISETTLAGMPASASVTPPSRGKRADVAFRIDGRLA